MNIRPSKIASAIASILACSLLAACGGGGGGGMVRSSPPPVSPPPASPPPADPPPAAQTGPCPAPVTGDCVVTIGIPGGWGTSEIMTGGRQSDHALVLRVLEPATLDLFGNYRFSGGTRIESGGLFVRDLLESDVTIAGTSDVYDPLLFLSGTVRGNVRNESSMIVGNQSCTSSACAPTARIEGNYSQSANATYSMMFGRSLQITGRADIEGGTLDLSPANQPGPGWTFPATPSSPLILHADGGVFGQFTRWTASSLFFITGSLRYGSNDVWFDLTRISMQAAASANGIGSPLTLASAGNIDRALAAADGFAGNPGIAQQQFLASAGRLLWMRNPLQARRALDTLSGLPQAQALDAALHEAGMSPALSAHLDRRAHTHAAGAWSQAGVTGTQTGFDQWLGPQLLAGVHAARGDGAQADAMLDASTQRDERSAGAYLRWFGNDGWYAGADAGYAQRTMLLDRPIDFGAAGRWNAHSRRTLDVADIGSEVGRRLPFAGGSLTPFLRLDAGAVRGADTIEQGDSGFELALDPVMQHRLATSTGLRYARDWRFAGGGWLQLQAGAGVQQTLWQGGDAQRAAFTGAPGEWFDLPGLSPRRSSWFDLGLHGGFGHDWRWAMQGMRGNDNEAWQLRLARDF